MQGRAAWRFHVGCAHQAAQVLQQPVLCTHVPHDPCFELKIRKRWGQFLRQQPQGWNRSGSSKPDLIIKSPVEGCVCWQQHSCIAHVWKCWEWQFFSAKTHPEPRCRSKMSSLAAAPPGEDLNSLLESTEHSVGCDNQAPTWQKGRVWGNWCPKTKQSWDKRAQLTLSLFIMKNKRLTKVSRWGSKEMHCGSLIKVSRHQFVIWGEAIVENSLLFVAFCHNEYLIKSKRAWQFTDTFPLPWGCLRASKTEGLHKGVYNLRPPFPP